MNLLHACYNSSFKGLWQYEQLKTTHRAKSRLPLLVQVLLDAAFHRDVLHPCSDSTALPVSLLRALPVHKPCETTRLLLQAPAWRYHHHVIKQHLSNPVQKSPKAQTQQYGNIQKASTGKQQKLEQE